MLTDGEEVAHRSVGRVLWLRGRVGGHERIAQADDLEITSQIRVPAAAAEMLAASAVVTLESYWQPILACFSVGFRGDRSGNGHGGPPEYWSRISPTNAARTNMTKNMRAFMASFSLVSTIQPP